MPAKSSIFFHIIGLDAENSDDEEEKAEVENDSEEIAMVYLRKNHDVAKGSDYV